MTDVGPGQGGDGVPADPGGVAPGGPGGRRRRKRMTAAEGRQALLAAGREMAHAQPAGPPLEHIRLTDVAQRAGVSVGALYHYWESQDDYRDDLLDEVFAPARFEPPDHPAPVPAPDVALVEVIRIGTQLEFERLRSSPDLRVLMAMWAAADPAIAPRVTAHFRAVGQQWAGFYEATFRAHGLEVRPPFTYEHLAALLAAIGDGLTVRASADPVSVPTDLREDPGDDEPWTLLGCALVALLPAFSRPVGSDGDFWEFLAHLRPDRDSGPSPQGEASERGLGPPRAAG